jgi:molybdopterin synthase sulfur carrier subunit
MRVFIPPPLRSYTGGRARVEGEGITLGAFLDSLDARYPGFRFRIVDEQDRIRPHIRFVVGEEFVHTLTHPLESRDEIQIICALSGGSPDSQGTTRRDG